MPASAAARPHATGLSATVECSTRHATIDELRGPGAPRRGGRAEAQAGFAPETRAPWLKKGLNSQGSASRSEALVSQLFIAMSFEATSLVIITCGTSCTWLASVPPLGGARRRVLQCENGTVGHSVGLENKVSSPADDVTVRVQVPLLTGRTVAWPQDHSCASDRSVRFSAEALSRDS